MTEEQTKSDTTSIKAEDSVNEKSIRDSEQSFIQDLECFLRTKRLEKGENSFVSEERISYIETYEIPPGLSIILVINTIWRVSPHWDYKSEN